MARIKYDKIADGELPHAVAPERYDLRILRASFNERGKTSGKPNVEVEVEILNVASAPTIYHYLSFADGEDSKKDAIKRGMTKAFCELFAIPFDEDGFDTDDFAGCTADNVPILLEKQENGRESNKIDLFNL